VRASFTVANSHPLPFTCLDEKYEEVKSITKMSVCFSSQCSYPKGMVERRFCPMPLANSSSHCSVGTSFKATELLCQLFCTASSDNNNINGTKGFLAIDTVRQKAHEVIVEAATVSPAKSSFLYYFRAFINAGELAHHRSDDSTFPRHAGCQRWP
jgi:hypothetical protein